jgi:hypothetical protein
VSLSSFFGGRSDGGVVRGWLGCLVCLLLCEEKIFNVAEVRVFACNVCLKFPLISLYIEKTVSPDIGLCVRSKN